MKSYDIVVVGGGVAGLTAGIFAARGGYAPLILSTESGGQTASTAEIENYPGIGKVEGPDLVNTFAHEAQNFGCVFLIDTIHGLTHGERITLEGARDSYDCRALIVATGKSPRTLGIPGEKEFFGRGVLCAGALDPEQFRTKHVAIAGGGNAALDAATRLAPFVASVTLIHRRDRFTAEHVLEDRLSRAQNISFIFNTTITEINGNECVQSLLLTSETEERTHLPVDALIVAVGYEVRSRWYASCLDCTDEGKIRIDDACRTNRSGIFAAGDCTTVPYQQIVISAGEGAKAALSASRYLHELDGTKSPRVDWGYVLR